MANWMDVINNPRGYTVKKTLFEFLKSRYAQNEDIIDRISYHLATEKDAKAFIQLMMDAYEIGYTTAVDQHKEQLAKVGIKVTVVKATKEEK
jgi:hypothetical protein